MCKFISIIIIVLFLTNCKNESEKNKPVIKCDTIVDNYVNTIGDLVIVEQVICDTIKP